MADQEKYLMLLLCRIKDAYYELSESDRKRITSEHVQELRQFSSSINHLVTIGGTYDQVALIEADSPKYVYDAAETFKTGNKGQYIEVVDAIFGIRVENKSDFAMIGNR